MPRAETPEVEDAGKQQEMFAIEDYDLPKTLVTRIAKAAVRAMCYRMMNSNLIRGESYRIMSSFRRRL